MRRLHASPVKLPSVYQQEQCDLFPGLVPYVEKEGKSQAAHVAKNLRILLKQRFPDTSFSVTVQRFGNITCSVQVAWTFFREPPTSARKEAVLAVARDFCSMSEHGETPTQKQLQQRFRFQSVFGQVDYVSLSQTRPTQDQLRWHRQQYLASTLPAPVAPRARPRM